MAKHLNEILFNTFIDPEADDIPMCHCAFLTITRLGVGGLVDCLKKPGSKECHNNNNNNVYSFKILNLIFYNDDEIA